MLKILTVSLFLSFISGAVSKGSESSGENSESSSESNSGEGGSSGGNTKSNYYRDYFADRVVPYAIDFCSASDYAYDTFILPTCTDSTHVTVSKYTSSDCSDTSLTESVMYNSSTAQFRCDGGTAYTEIIYSLDECLASYPTYLATDVCITVTPFLHSMTSCTSASTTIGLYSTSSCASKANITYSVNATCLTSGMMYDSEDVFIQFIACTTVTTTTSPTTTKTGGESGSGEAGSGEAGGAITTTVSMYTTGSISVPGSSSGESMVSLKNVFGIFVMISCLLIGQL